VCRGWGCPANYGRNCAGRAADDNVLWRLALQPHRVHDDIEEDRKGEQGSGFDIERKSKEGHGAASKDKPKYKRFGARDFPTRNWTPDGASHERIDIGVVPHVEHTGGASARRDGENCGSREKRIEVTGRNLQSNERREHRKRHHTRLHECNKTR